MAVMSVFGTKYPLMSRTRSVSLDAKKHAAPLVPAGRMAATALVRPSELRLEASGCGCPQGKAVRNPSGPCGTTVIFSEYACAVFGIPQTLLGMANALAVAWPRREGPPNGPVGLRVSAMRQGVTGTKLKPASVASPISVAEAVLPMPPFTDLPACAGLVGPGVRVGEGLGTRVEVAENRDWDLGVGSGVPTPPPQPTKEDTTRDKQINERVPWTQKVGWRRIDYLPGNIR